jgi:hypothetical protein
MDEGQTWQYTNDQIQSNDCWSYRGIAYGNGTFVAITGTGGFGRISSSPDGVHWREYESTNGSDGIVFGGGKFVADGFTSTDGYNFNFRSLNVDMGDHEAFAYLNGTYFVTGILNGIAVSPDGDNYTITLPNYTSPDVNAYFSNIVQFAVGNGIVVGVAPDRLVSTSDGGVTWTNQDDFFGYGSTPPTTALEYNNLRSILFDGTQFVVYGGSGNYGQTATTWKSTDGVNWTMALSSGTPVFVGGDPSSHLVGNPGYNPLNMFRSLDLGATWTAATSITLSSFYDFSTPQTPVADPPIADTDFTNWSVSNVASGIPSSDPNLIPVLPPSVLYSEAQLLATACGNALPPGR